MSFRSRDLRVFLSLFVIPTEGAFEARLAVKLRVWFGRCIILRICLI